MKLDKYSLALPLTARQRFFAGCWFNLVHQHSLDSHRAAAMNSLNILPELLRIYELGKTDERKAVREEASRLLGEDPVLRDAPFVFPCTHILELTNEKGVLATSKEEGKGVQLLTYFVKELEYLLADQYIPACLNALASLLSQADPPAGKKDERLNDIQVVCNGLVSALIYKRASLESLYSLYSEILVPRYSKPTYNFMQRFEMLRKFIEAPAVEHRIVLTLDNVTAPEKFPTAIGGFEFSIAPPFAANATDKSHLGLLVIRYLEERKRRLFASMAINAQDPRAAGAQAAERLNDILNLVRFEYERDRVSTPSSFAFVLPSRPTRPPRVFSLPAVVPNPSTPMDVDGLAAFVKSVDELVLHAEHFSSEGRDRMMSAFRLYRTGLDADTLENKLVNWWTALEFLVRGNANQSGGIGKSVEDLVAPVLCRSYITKHLLAYRAALIEAGAKPSESDGTSIELKALSPDKLFKLMQRTDVQAQLISAAKQHEFFIWQLERAFATIGDPKLTYERHFAHERRVRWQLQRLWRARCDVVHSAERSASAALLCANLEYYLKNILMALLKALRNSPTLSGPKEFFDRQALAHEQVQNRLRSGSFDALVNDLST